MAERSSIGDQMMTPRIEEDDEVTMTPTRAQHVIITGAAII